MQITNAVTITVSIRNGACDTVPLAPKPGEPAKAEEGGDGNYEDVQVNPNNVPDAPK